MNNAQCFGEKAWPSPLCEHCLEPLSETTFGFEHFGFGFKYVSQDGFGLRLIFELQNGLKRRLPVPRCVLENAIGIKEDIFYGHETPGDLAGQVAREAGGRRKVSALTEW